MITVQRHPNLDNWLEVRYFGKLLDQFTSTVQAYAFAKKQAQDKKAPLYNLDRGELKRND